MRSSLPLLLSLTTVGTLWGQIPSPTPAPVPTLKAEPQEPQELVLLRQKYALKAATASRQLAELYSKALQNLEQESALSGDYDQALAAQRRRREITSLYQSPQGDTLSGRAIVLAPADARVTGATTYDRATNSLGYFRTTGSSATWDIMKITPGLYDVILTYGVAPYGDNYRGYYGTDYMTGGEFDVFEESNLSGASKNRRSTTVRSTGDWNKTETQTLPALNIMRTSTRLAIKVIRPLGGGGVMSLKEVRLVPSTGIPVDPPAGGMAAEAETAPALPPAEEYRQLMVMQQNRLSLALAPIIAHYQAELQTLGTQAEQENAQAVASDVKAEKRRTARWLENPALSLQRARSRQAGSLADAGEEWTTASYVPDPQNDGDRFYLMHEGEKVLVRLAGISCPPHTATHADALKAHAKYFDISPEDALQIGQETQKFTDALLFGRPFLVTTRGVTAADGALYISIQLPDLGDYAGVLVDNGLAAVVPPPPNSDLARVTPDTLLESLRSREKTAQQRAVPVGAWSLRKESSTDPVAATPTETDAAP